MHSDPKMEAHSGTKMEAHTVALSKWNRAVVPKWKRKMKIKYICSLQYLVESEKYSNLSPTPQKKHNGRAQS